MELLHLLKPEAVKVVSTVSSKKRLLHVVGELANSVYGLDVTETVSACKNANLSGRPEWGMALLCHMRAAKLWNMS
jgi:PTS system nitrogen regulatory IIA component